jgi:hypothetical protein
MNFIVKFDRCQSLNISSQLSHMKIKGLIVLLPFIMLSCNNTENGSGPAERRMIKQLLTSSIEHVRTNFKDARHSVTEDGMVLVGDEQITCAINPSDIVLGLIDDDANEDAIVTVTSYRGRIPFKTEQLIMIKKGRKFILSAIIEADMKIIEIKDMLISAEISTMPSDSPIHDCEVCKEIVKYQFTNGNLVRTE